MTVSLGGVVLNSNLYLDGIENAPRIAVNKFRHLAGTSTLQTMSMSGGDTLILTTTNDKGVRQGCFTQAQIESLKALEGAGVAVTLTYRERGNFNVLIRGTNFRQLEQNVAYSASKQYTGSITLEEI